MENAAEIINLWDSPKDLAIDIGTTALNVRAMRRLDSIPNKYWSVLVLKAGRRGFKGVTLDVLAGLSDKKRKEALLPQPEQAEG